MLKIVLFTGLFVRCCCVVPLAVFVVVDYMVVSVLYQGSRKPLRRGGTHQRRFFGRGDTEAGGRPAHAQDGGATDLQHAGVQR